MQYIWWIMIDFWLWILYEINPYTVRIRVRSVRCILCLMHKASVILRIYEQNIRRLVVTVDAAHWRVLLKARKCPAMTYTLKSSYERDIFHLDRKHYIYYCVYVNLFFLHYLSMVKASCSYTKEFLTIYLS